jgi:DNA-binding IclR family transcriptional regulator
MASAKVRRFVERRIATVQQLDILICLHCEPARFWDASAVARRLRLSRGEAAQGLETLARNGLLDVRLEASVLYRFSPATTAMTTTVMHVAEAYRQCRDELRAVVTSHRRPTRN